jgi:hypothetical protein
VVRCAVAGQVFLSLADLGLEEDQVKASPPLTYEYDGGRQMNVLRDSPRSLKLLRRVVGLGWVATVRAGLSWVLRALALQG